MSEEQSTNLWLFLEVLAKRRRFILTLVILLTLVAVVVSLVLPKYYEATALLLPPKDVSMPVAGMSRISEVVSVTKGLNLPVMVTTSDVYRRMLQSHRIVDPIIDQYDLVRAYGARNVDEAYLDLMESCRFRVTAEGLLEIAVENRSPERAADMVNSFVDLLDRVNREIASTRATDNRQFISERLQQVGAELDSARAAFEAFQMRHKAVDFDQQIRVATEQAITLKVRLAEIDIDLKILENKLSGDNTELVEARQKRKIVADQLALLESTNVDSSFFSLPISSIPALKGQYEKLYSRVRVNESLHRTLLEQLEQAKIQENEELPTITILDRAEPPQMRSRPRRAVIVVGTFIVALVLAVLIAALMEYFVRLRKSHPEDYERAAAFKRAFFGWLPGMKKAGK